MSLLDPSPETPEQDVNNEWDPDERTWKPATRRWHGPVWQASERCRVSLLRLNRTDKVLYSSEFHPERTAQQVSGEASGAYLDGDEAHRDAEHRDHPSTYWMTDAHGERLLLNFISIASAAWARVDNSRAHAKQHAPSPSTHDQRGARGRWRRPGRTHAPIEALGSPAHTGRAVRDRRKVP